MTSLRLPSPRSAALLGVVLLSLSLPACAGGGEEGFVHPSSTDDAGAAADTGLTVTAEGRGVVMLRLDADNPAGGGHERLDGKLISGPGGCLSIQPGGRPELLLFDQDASFADNPPRVSWDGSEVAVGERFSVGAAKVRVTELQGVPERCARGAADIAWIVGTP